MTRVTQRVGWFLMGYPWKIGYRRIVFTPPFWKQIYRLGANIYNWR